MASKPLPKPAAERTLQRKYQVLAIETKGRIDISTERGKALSELLHTYCAAFANLYGTITAYTAWKIICELEPELISGKKLLKKDFMALTDILRVENLPYYVLEIDELYPGEPAGKPADREFVSKDLVRRGMGRFYRYYELLETQGDKPFCMMEKEEFLAWANPNQFRKSQEAQEMMRFLENLPVSTRSKNKDVNGRPIRGRKLCNLVFWHKIERSMYDDVKRDWEKKEIAEENNVVESEKLMRQIERYIQCGNLRISPAKELEWLTKDMAEVGVELSQKQLEKFLQLYVALNQKSCLRCNRGWSPEQLSGMYRGSGGGMPTITFGPGMQAAFASGELDREELSRMIREKGFGVEE